MPKPKKRLNISQTVSKSTRILLDENFLLCASGQGCDSKENSCSDEPAERKRRALIALLMAYEGRVLLVLDDEQPSQVARIYRSKYEQMTSEVRDLVVDWLRGQGRTITVHKSSAIKPKIIADCNLNHGKLDLLLCQLAIACRGDAPIWTLDSDFWCAAQFHPEIHPTCPKDALDSVR